MTKNIDPIVTRYQELLDCWNRRAADEFGVLFTEHGNVVGFDGSQVNGRGEIGTHLRQIFAHHHTPAYVGKVREIRMLTSDVAVLRAVAGMVPSGQADVNPALNSIQTLVMTRQEGDWRVELFQTTPAALHEQPELSESLTQELRDLLHAT